MQQNPTQDNQITALASHQRNKLFRQIHRNHPVCCLYTRRKPKGKKTKQKFYFFTEDTENLIVAATVKKNKGTIYKFSTSSKDVKRKSPFYVGLCSDAQTKKVFIGAKSYPEKPGLLFNSIRITTGDEEVGDPIILAPPSDQDFRFPETPETPLPNDAFFLVAKKINDITNVTNPEYYTVQVLLGEETVLSLHQIAEDEFEAEISYPLSLFQAFCIACTLTNI
ncbi:hypothetical protein TRFO_16543 [Tritrichomonas foetus]|uniref:Uncharacterized protein n=1 Tax=Tritrichomonas foetus TaxID=1144522 RepID=A0A1J4KQ20_9EUKA|nr:hypothetical protein TRFO_16543 [Tritrichomonas foetus]|eukprot:OHT13339.1 hypothetical protein TRFO_16543 [Tritrichomonas foetus]